MNIYCITPQVIGYIHFNSPSKSSGGSPMAIPAVDRAKRPISPLAGPYGHPFHPILVTIPIGAWVASLIFDIATKVNSAGSVSFVNASYWLIGIGVIGAVLAAVFGLMDLLTIPRSTKALRVGLAHMGLNLTV